MSLGNTPWIWFGLIKGNWLTQRCSERMSSENTQVMPVTMNASLSTTRTMTQTQCTAGLNPRKRLLTAVWLRISSASPVKIISIMLILLWGRRSMNLNWKLTMLSFSERSLSNAIHLISAVFLVQINEDIIAALYMKYFKLTHANKQKSLIWFFACHYLCNIRIPNHWTNEFQFIIMHLHLYQFIALVWPIIKYFTSNHN